MIIGAHVIISSTNSHADRGFLREILELPHVDAGGGWLIFGLPPAEVAVHPAEKNDVHECYFMCDDIEAFVQKMHDCSVMCSPVQQQAWGLLTHVTLPGGGKVGVYQPRHSRPKPITTRSALKRSTRRGSRRRKRVSARRRTSTRR